jgi:hypothetical protein
MNHIRTVKLNIRENVPKQELNNYISKFITTLYLHTHARTKYVQYLINTNLFIRQMKREVVQQYFKSIKTMKVLENKNEKHNSYLN